MNNEHPINGLLDSSMQNLRSLVDANTVIGEAITTPDGTVIIPVSKVSFGFGSASCSAAVQAAVSRYSRWHSLWSRTGMSGCSSSTTARTSRTAQFH